MKKRSERGMSLIEVLVTMVIFAIGALGLAGMQLASLKYNNESSARSTATLLTIELTDRMRANMAGVKSGAYVRNMSYTAARAATLSPPNCGTTSDCNKDTLAQLDLSTWLNSIALALPAGTGAVVPVAGNTSVSNIVVMWQEKSLVDTNATDPNCATPRVIGVRCFSTTFMP